VKRWAILMLVGVLLTLTLACGGGGGNDESTTSATDQVVIEVVNRAPEDVCYVYISETDSDAWGDDQLGDDDTIATGSRMTFEFPPGMYDVRLENCDEATMETAWQVTSDTTVTAGADGATSWVLFENQSSVEVCYIFISPSDGDDWGDDWMGGNENIPSGAQRLFYVEPGVYDLLAQDCDQQDLAEVYEADLTDGRPWILAED